MDGRETVSPCRSYTPHITRRFVKSFRSKTRELSGRSKAVGNLAGVHMTGVDVPANATADRWHIPVDLVAVRKGHDASPIRRSPRPSTRETAWSPRSENTAGSSRAYPISRATGDSSSPRIWSAPDGLQRSGRQSFPCLPEAMAVPSGHNRIPNPSTGTSGEKRSGRRSKCPNVPTATSATGARTASAPSPPRGAHHNDIARSIPDADGPAKVNGRSAVEPSRAPTRTPPSTGSNASTPTGRVIPAGAQPATPFT